MTAGVRILPGVSVFWVLRNLALIALAGIAFFWMRRRR